MNKAIFSFLTATLLLLFYAGDASASLVVIKTNGNLALNVLGLSVEKPESLEIKAIALGESSDSSVSFEKTDGGKVSLNIVSNGETQAYDVTDYKDEIVEIEERGQAQRVSIAHEGGNFLIRQKDLTAQTAYPIGVNPKTAEITISTPTGARYLAILPYNAFEIALRAKILNELSKSEKLELKEDESGKLAYIIPGERILDLFQIIEYKVPVKASISATTGEVLSIDAPSWYKILGFLFTT